MTDPPASQLDPHKFRDPFVTVKGERRAWVALKALDTLWFNTGTLCNLTCQHCYIESSPKNDRLVYLTAAEVARYLDEIEAGGLPTSLIGFTGGEPFMNQRNEADGQVQTGIVEAEEPLWRAAHNPRLDRSLRAGGA
jgi:4Fe-4S single cluster domain